jgi:RHS repeat-associated protein
MRLAIVFGAAVLIHSPAVAQQCDNGYDPSCNPSATCEGIFVCGLQGTANGSISGTTPNPGSPKSSGPQSTNDQNQNPSIPKSAQIQTIVKSLQSNANLGIVNIVNSLGLETVPVSSGYVVIADPGTQQWLGAIPSAGSLPTLQAQATPAVRSHVDNSEPVAGDGEFTIDETDLNLPGMGIPFVFARHYRSGIDYQTPLGFGWNHTFNQRLVLATQAFPGAPGSIPDVILINDKLEQLRFTFQNVSSDGQDTYNLAGPGTGILRRLHNTPAAAWRLDIGDSLTYLFDGIHGYLTSITDNAGHAIRVDWSTQPNNPLAWGSFRPKVVDVIDTTGRKIYFNYKDIGFSDPTWKWINDDTPLGSQGNYVNGNFSVGDSGVEYLQCLSLTQTCDTPLVSFDIAVIAALSDKLPDSPGEKWYGANIVQYALEFDLVKVHDSKGYGPSYKYYVPPSPTYNSYQVYQKEFDDYWPSQYAAQLYNYFVQEELPSAPRVVTGIDFQCYALARYLLTTYPYYISCNAYCLEEATSVNESNALFQQCHKEMPTYVDALKSKIPKTYEYGTPPQLFHNVIEIDDANGRVIVQNTYGSDALLPSFDHVIKQVLGGNVSATTTYSYTDSQRTVVVGNQNNVPKFAPVTICPASGTGYGSAVTQSNAYWNGAQTPALEIVSSGPLGRGSKLYFDAAGRLLREIDGLGWQTNYNYVTAGQSGMQLPSGERLCAQYDAGGKPVTLTDLPAPGLPGGPLVTSFQYDAKEEPMSASQTDAGTLISSTAFVRDSWERVVGVGDEVDSSHTRWTCFQYTDIMQSIQPIEPVRPLDRATASPSPSNGAGQPGQPAGPEIPSRLPHCLFGSSSGSSLSVKAVFPSLIIRPDGTETALTGITPTGPGETVVDIKGIAPVDRYFGYDSYGRLNKVGTRDFTTKQNVPGSEIRWDTDLEGLLQAIHVPDATNPSNTLDTIYTYDNSRNPQSIVSPLLTQQITTDVFSNVTSVVSTPKNGNGSSGTPRSRCANYNPYGQVTEMISPEGDVVDLDYDLNGNVTLISAGPTEVAPRKDNYSPCVARQVVRSIRTRSQRETVKQFQYSPSGELAEMIDGVVQYQYAYDGVGRLIDTYVPDHDLYWTLPKSGTKEANPVGYHYASGYRGHRKAWSILSDQAFPTEQLPAYLTKGVHAAEEYSYDLIGRPLQVKQWQFTEQPTLAAEADPYSITTISYDDAKNTEQITTPEQTVNTIQKDGADRPVGLVFAKGAAEQLSTTLAYTSAGAIQTAVTSPAPTPTGTFTQIDTFAPLGAHLQRQDQGQVVLQRQLDPYGRVSQEQLPSDVLRTYSYDAFNQPLTLQEQEKSGVMFTAGTFSWNRDGNLLTTLDGANNSTARTYDVLGRIIALTSGLGTTSYQYITGTSMPMTINGPAANITYAYDLGGKIATSTIADSSGRGSAGNRTLQYSPLGLITGATVSPAGGQAETTAVLYDSLGRPVSESDSLSGVTVNTVYALREKTTSFTTGATTSSIDRRFDALGRPSVLQVNGSQVAQWTYAAGAPSAINYLGGTQVAFGYDPLGRVISETAENGNSAIASVNRSFGSDAIPHQYTLKVGTTPVETNYFTTDDAGRVTAEEAAHPGVATPPATLDNSGVLPHLDSNARQYTLDGAANWLARSGPQPLNTVVDSANRYSSINGQTVQNISGGGIQSFGTQQYGWDGLNQLTSATVGTNSRQWQYDALGRPSSSKDGQGNSSRLIWDGDSPVGSVADGNSANLTVFAGFDGQDTVALLSPRNSMSYLHHGPDQSVFAVTDSSGKLSQAYSYTAFGEPHTWSPSGVSAGASAPMSPFLFQGAFYGSEVGLYRMGARTYQPALGRFLSPDPIGSAGGLNLFAFVEGRPLSLEDPDGTSGRPAATATQNRPSQYTSWTSTLTSDYFQRLYHEGVNQAFGSGNGILTRGIGITNMIFGSPLAVAESISNVPGAFIGNIIDQNILRSQGQYGLADRLSNIAGEKIQLGLFSTAAAYGVGSSLLSGASGTAASGGTYLSSGIANADATRGIATSKFGGILSSQANAAGGTLYTSVGGIGKDVVGGAVNNAMISGETNINILSGVHGLPDASRIPELSFYEADQAFFGNLPGVSVHDISTWSDEQIINIVNGPGTTIGAFCNSGICLAPFIK